MYEFIIVAAEVHIGASLVWPDWVVFLKLLEYNFLTKVAKKFLKSSNFKIKQLFLEKYGLLFI